MTDLLPTTEEEQALLLNHWRNSPTISNIARRLIAEVKRLGAKNDLEKRACGRTGSHASHTHEWVRGEWYFCNGCSAPDLDDERSALYQEEYWSFRHD